MTTETSIEPSFERQKEFAKSHERLPSGDLITLIKRGLEAFERELTKKRFAVGTKPRRARSVQS